MRDPLSPYWRAKVEEASQKFLDWEPSVHDHRREPRVVDAPNRRGARAPRPPTLALTPTEARYLKMMDEAGITATELARRLRISRQGVCELVANARRKLDRMAADGQ